MENFDGRLEEQEIFSWQSQLFGIEIRIVGILMIPITLRPFYVLIQGTSYLFFYCKINRYIYSVQKLSETSLGSSATGNNDNWS